LKLTKTQFLDNRGSAVHAFPSRRHFLPLRTPIFRWVNPRSGKGVIVDRFFDLCIANDLSATKGRPERGAKHRYLGSLTMQTSIALQKYPKSAWLEV
jgi:hypothetical protein